MVCLYRATRLLYAEDRAIYQYEKPYSVLSFLNDGAITTNLKWQEGNEEKIYNIRGEEHKFTLDGQGFRFCRAPTNFDGWQSRQMVEEMYLPEVKEMLKQEVEAVDEVEIFDWRVS